MNLLLFLRLCLDDIRYDWQRSLLNILKLSVMVLTFLLVVMFGQAAQAFSTGFVNSAHNLLIVSQNVLDPMDSSLDPALLEEAAQAVEAQFGPGTILTTAPVFFRHIRLENRMLQVLAAPEQTFDGMFQLTLIEGQWPAATTQVAASQGTALNTNWQVGQTLVIYGQSFTLTGIFETSSRGAASLWMTYPAGVVLFGLERGIQIGAIQVNPQADLPTIQAWLEAYPPLAGRYAVYQESQLNEQLTLALKGLMPLGRLFQFMGFLMIAFGGFNVASLTLQERQAEISILFQLQFTRRAVQIFVMIRGVILGLAAYPLGWAAAWVAQRPHQSGLVIYGAHLDLSLNNQVAWLGLGVVVLSLVAGAWAAVQAVQEGE